MQGKLQTTASAGTGLDTLSASPDGPSSSHAASAATAACTTPAPPPDPTAARASGAAEAVLGAAAATEAQGLSVCAIGPSSAAAAAGQLAAHIRPGEVDALAARAAAATAAANEVNWLRRRGGGWGEADATGGTGAVPGRSGRDAWCVSPREGGAASVPSPAGLAGAAALGLAAWRSSGKSSALTLNSSQPVSQACGLPEDVPNLVLSADELSAQRMQAAALTASTAAAILRGPASLLPREQQQQQQQHKQHKQSHDDMQQSMPLPQLVAAAAAASNGTNGMVLPTGCLSNTAAGITSSPQAGVGWQLLPGAERASVLVVVILFAQGAECICCMPN